jgi:mannose-6-phosphate isomerase-like protein (cupin superfamily)
MRSAVTVLTLLAISGALAAQQPAAPKLYASAADVSAMMDKAKNDHKADQANFIQPILRLAPISANLEYRIAIPQAASVHEKEAEVFYVVDGAATLVTGGKLKDERRTNAENLGGSGIDGGTSRQIAKGDFAMVPENTPHWFTDIKSPLVLMSLHVPHTGGDAK